MFLYHESGAGMFIDPGTWCLVTAIKPLKASSHLIVTHHSQIKYFNKLSRHGSRQYEAD